MDFSHRLTNGMDCNPRVQGTQGPRGGGANSSVPGPGTFAANFNTPENWALQTPPPPATHILLPSDMQTNRQECGITHVYRSTKPAPTQQALLLKRPDVGIKNTAIHFWNMWGREIILLLRFSV